MNFSDMDCQFQVRDVAPFVFGVVTPTLLQEVSDVSKFSMQAGRGIPAIRLERWKVPLGMVGSTLEKGFATCFFCIIRMMVHEIVNRCV